ncbi:MAG: ankyrin repeat domain-containing protein [Spirochaetes bacterium]|nr:ankyrin repeat domain-containing protein [Spirochaetota bacterium]
MLCSIPVIGLGGAWGYDIASDSYRYSKRKFKEEMDSAETYRFVRFLPEYAWVGWSNRKLTEPLTVYNKGKSVLTSKGTDIPATVNIVTLGFYADTVNAAEVNKARYSFGRAGDSFFRNEQGDSGLHLAVKNNNIEDVKKLIAMGADLDIKDSGQSPFYKAVMKNRLEIAELLLKNGADINAKDNSGYTALNAAVVYEKVSLVKQLVKWKADVNIKTDSGWAPLHNAVLYNNAEITDLLLKNGADTSSVIEKKYKQYPAGSTALQIADINNNSEIRTLLKKYGAK